jgi:hypothetical protein
VNDGRDFGEVRHDARDAFGETARLVATRRRNLRRLHGVRNLVVNENVGEGTADIDADHVALRTHATHQAASFLFDWNP